MKSSRQGKSGSRSSRNTRARNGRYSLASNLNGLGNSAQQALRAGRQAVSSAYGVASGLSRSLPRARDMVPHTPLNLQRMVDNNPLLIGVIGVGVGLLLGALMPTSTAIFPERRAPARKSSRMRRAGAAKRSRSARRPGKQRSSAQTGNTSQPVATGR